MNQLRLSCRSRNVRPELRHGRVSMTSSVLPALPESPLLRPNSTAITPQRLADLLISESLRLPRQHSSSTRLQRLVDAARLCIDRIYDLIRPLVFGSLPAIASQILVLRLYPAAQVCMRAPRLTTEIWTLWTFPWKVNNLNRSRRQPLHFCRRPRCSKLFCTRVPCTFHCRFHDELC